MTTYLLFIFAIILLGYICIALESKFHRPFRVQYIVVVSILLALQSGLRNVAVGADTYQYFQRFENIKYTTWESIQSAFVQYYLFGTGKAPGYDILQKSFQFVLPNYQLFLILIAVLFFSSLGYFIYKNTTRISDAILAYVLYSCLFFSFFSITGHRQTIATAASLYAYEFVKKRKFIQFFLIIIVASTVHKSALIFFPFYFIARLRNVKLFYWAAIFVVPILMLYRVEFLQLLQYYGGYERYEPHEATGTYTFSLMLILVASVSLWRMNQVLKRSEMIKPIYLAFLVALLFTPLTWVNPTAMRAVQYYSIFMLLLLPAIIASFEVQSARFRQLVYTVSLFVLIGLFVRSNINSVYGFFWQDMASGANY